MSKRKHRRNGPAPEDGTRITRAAEKRVRKADRQHRCHERCEHLRSSARSGAMGCSNCLGTLPLILGVLAAIIIVIAAITGKL